MKPRKSGFVLFQNSKHHRQVLHEQIDQNMINNIELTSNPSQNYRKAYQCLYQDSLEQTVQQYAVKKSHLRKKNEQDNLLYTNGIKGERSSMADQNDMSASKLTMYGPKYVDYDQHLTTKKQDHIKRNYDGGQAFYKCHDQHLRKKHIQSVITNQTLQSQMHQKQVQKQQQQQTLQNQSFAMRQYKQHQSLTEYQRNQEQKYNQRNFRLDMMQQIQEEKIRKKSTNDGKTSRVARHNPITNPIQYHIQNPYILRDIQIRQGYSLGLRN